MKNQETFNTLFFMNSTDFKVKMINIVGGNIKEYLSKGTIKKVLINEIPNELKIDWYDSYIINPDGIYFVPEHGSRQLVRKFDKYFTL